MAEIELQGARKASDCGPQDHGLGKTFSQDNDEQQLDVLCRLGKRPILKVQSPSRLRGRPCGADSDSAISVSFQSWALFVPF